MTALSHIRRRWIALAPLTALAVLLVWAASAERAAAQTPALVLSDFDATGLDVEMAVLFQAPATITAGLLFARGVYGDVGTILDGADSEGNVPIFRDPAHAEDPADGGNLIRLRSRNSNTRINLNQDGSLVFSEYFGAGGAGHDLSLYLQTVAGTVYSATVSSTLANVGGGFVNFDIPSATMGTALAGISGGDRFIFALARTAPENNAPAFATETATRTVSEDAADGAAVGDAVTATDTDTDDTLEYSISGDNNFTIDSSTGQIEVATGASLDYETATSHTVTVTATDSTATATITVTINVTNVDEPGSVTLSASQPVAGTALTAALTDPDGSITALTWQWASSATPTGTFTDITGATSDSYTPVAGDVGEYLRATASYTDGEGASKTAAAVTANAVVAGVQPNRAPAFADTIAARAVDENVSTGTNVGAPITAIDADSDTLTYSIEGTNTGGFTVDSSGQIKTGGALDHETADEYVITLRATDPSGLFDEIEVTITVNDVTNELASPSFAEAAYTRTIHENAAVGTAVGAPVAASDPGEALTYTLAGTDAGAFTIDGGTGQLRVNAALDYETKASYSVTVTATDPSGFTGTADVTVNVVDLDEVEDLGSVEFTVGCNGTDCGYVQGSYGALASGDFPEQVFESGNARTVQEFQEDADGFWYWRYQGGTANNWLAGEEDLKNVLVRVSYEDGRDHREFVLGGFIVETDDSNGLKIDPPIPSRDFETRTGETVTVEFLRHIPQRLPVVTELITGPDPSPGSIVEFISETTPGGPVVAQSLIVLLVYGLWMFKKTHSTQSLLMAGVVLVLTPWISVIFQLGTPLAAAINFANILLGAYVYKYFFEGREQYA